METAKTRALLSKRGMVETFDVTCVIGTVAITDDPEAPSPHVVAFKLIAEHDAPGTYTFPTASGGTCRVTVEYE